MAKCKFIPKCILKDDSVADIPKGGAQLMEHLGSKLISFSPNSKDYGLIQLDYLNPSKSKISDLKAIIFHIEEFSQELKDVNTNTWTTTTLRDDICACILNLFESVFVDGVAYWRTWSKNNGGDAVLCFDVVEGVLRSIPLPKVDYCISSFQQFGQSVAYFTDDLDFTDINVWILSGDSMNDFFWEKKFSVSLPEDIRTDVLGIRNNGHELILSKFHDCDLVSYNCEDDEVKDFVMSGNRWIGIDRKDIDDNLFEQSPFIIRPFAETLVLLDAD
ncbi:hypothetical protein AgCh_000166 [Apium graveolens]